MAKILKMTGIVALAAWVPACWVAIYMIVRPLFG